jgi:hypothetical protein
MQAENLKAGNKAALSKLFNHHKLCQSGLTNTERDLIMSVHINRNIDALYIRHQQTRHQQTRRNDY